MNMTMKMCISVVSILAFATIDAGIVKSNVSA